MTKSPPQPSGSGATGPRTPEGRERVAQNARKHGLTRTSPDTQSIAALVDSWLSDPHMQAIPRVMLWRFAQERTQIARTVAHQAAILDQLTDKLDGASEQGQSGDPAKPATRDTALKDFALSMRYRAEAESRARSALCDIIQSLEDTSQTDGGANATP